MRSIFLFIWSWLKTAFQKIFDKAQPEGAPEEPLPDGSDRPEPEPGTYVCYYGCPNSKKAEKLQLRKQLYR